MSERRLCRPGRTNRLAPPVRSTRNVGRSECTPAVQAHQPFVAHTGIPLCAAPSLILRSRPDAGLRLGPQSITPTPTPASTEARCGQQWRPARPRPCPGSSPLRCVVLPVAAALKGGQLLRKLADLGARLML